MPEEKRTDVNIAVQLLGDCFLNKTDSLVIVTADSDIVPPIEFIKRNFPEKKLKIYFPPQVSSYDLQRVSIKKPIYLEHNKIKFINSIMDETVCNSDKSDSATIPDEWK